MLVLIKKHEDNVQRLSHSLFYGLQNESPNSVLYHELIYFKPLSRQIPENANDTYMYVYQ